MSSTRTILRFNLALDCILIVIVQLRATVVTPLCRPPSLRLRVVPPVRRKRLRKRRSSSRRAYTALYRIPKLIAARQTAALQDFNINKIPTLISRRQAIAAQQATSVSADMSPPPAISPAPSAVSSVEFVMDPSTFSPQVPASTPFQPAPWTPSPNYNTFLRPIRHRQLPAFPPSPPPVPSTRLTYLALRHEPPPPVGSIAISFTNHPIVEPPPPPRRNARKPKQPKYKDPPPQPFFS